MASQKIIILFALVVVVCATCVASQDPINELINTLQSGSSQTVAAMRNTMVNVLNNFNQYRSQVENQMRSITSRLPSPQQIASIPDKLMRAEMTMLRDEVNMATKSLTNPLNGIINAPQDLMNMFNGMRQQIES